MHQYRRDKYRERQLEAAMKNIEAARARFGFVHDIQPIGPRTLEEMGRQWGEGGKWDWPSILGDHKAPHCWCFAMWCHGRLCAMVSCRLDGSRLHFTYMDGDPRPDCPMKPHRLAIALDAMVRYAHLCGATEVWIEPTNEALANRCVMDYMFVPVDGSNELRLVLR